jgi:hypothetical protein
VNAYRVVKVDKVWIIVGPNGFLKTPVGNPVGSTIRSVALKGLRDCRARGEKTEKWSIYALLCSYCDFGGVANRNELIDAIVAELEEDPLYQELLLMISRSPSALFVKLDHDPAFRFMKEVGLIEALSECGPIGTSIPVGPLQSAYQSYLKTRSMKYLMALVYACASFHAPIAMAGLLSGRLTAGSVKEILLEESEGRTWPFEPRDFVRNIKELATFATGVDDRDIVLSAFAE